MKKTLISTLILITGISAVQAQTQKVITPNSYLITKKHVQKICPNPKAVFFITYPQITNLKTTKVQSKVNNALEKSFNDYRNGKCDDFINNESYQEDLNFQTKLKKDNLLSIYYSSTGTLNPSAHPTNLMAAYNFDLKTGNLLKLKDLFKSNTNYKNKLKPLIIASLTKNNLPEFGADKDNDYEFYLTEKKLVIINLFDNHALQGFESEINYSDIKDILRPDLKLR